jgi:hypothetical protein
VGKAVGKAKTHNLQENSVVPDLLWETVCDMVKLGVPVENISGVISAVNESQGVKIVGSLS